MQIPNIKASNKIKNQIKIMKTSAHLRRVSGLWGKEGGKLLSGFWAIRFWASTTNALNCSASYVLAAGTTTIYKRC